MELIMKVQSLIGNMFKQAEKGEMNIVRIENKEFQEEIVLTVFLKVFMHWKRYSAADINRR